ncbi:MAG: methyltransferase domain-containing protein [Desulfobacteraceae bacterium]|nr:methyltransferase domain-containing protein [Desulfobacteraceae bacterium]
MDSRRIDSDSTVDMVFHLKWKSDGAAHTDGYQASRINIWRDYIPPSLLAAINGKQAGERFELQLTSDAFDQNYTEQNLIQIKGNQFDPQSALGAKAIPAVGRFYPRGILKSVAGVFSANVQPFRLVHLSNGNMKVDFNHPLAGKGMVLSGIVGKVENKGTERGGSSVDWLDVLTTGPGMQARWQSQQTDFFSDEAFARDDEMPDTVFYKEPRLVQHIDDTAIEIIRNTYGRFLKDDMDVLDLMSSWQSHLPEKLNLRRLAGLGLNELELKKNFRLGERVVQDLNLNPVLPFESDSFDAVVCTVSVEYLTHPLAVFEEVSRVLRAGGYFIVTFSNRWFPTKAIRIWKELHEFERMGMVLEYFMRSGRFKELQTYSFRGLPRPHDDKYFPDLVHSDPVYAVWGQKR